MMRSTASEAKRILRRENELFLRLLWLYEKFPILYFQNNRLSYLGPFSHTPGYIHFKHRETLPYLSNSYVTRVLSSYFKPERAVLIKNPNSIPAFLFLARKKRISFLFCVKNVISYKSFSIESNWNSFSQPIFCMNVQMRFGCSS